MNRNAVEQIKERIPIEDLIGSYVKLEKSGKSLKARCPFHNEKSPSFFVSPDRGGYYCFGCGAKGDIFSFVEQFEWLDFRGALKILAERAGVKLVFDQKADGERDRLFEVMELATTYFEEQLSKNKEASDYVTSRGITPQTQKEFRIGWAPEGWGNLHTFLKSKGYSDALLERAGLIKKREDSRSNNASALSAEENSVSTAQHEETLLSSRGQGMKGVVRSDYYDRFRGRVMFPISDSSGRIVAFSGRILKDDGKSAKYLNSPDTPLFDKSQILYGLDKAKSEIRRLGYTILVEGQMDLVMSHQAGIKTVLIPGDELIVENETNEDIRLNNTENNSSIHDSNNTTITKNNMTNLYKSTRLRRNDL
ncbi:MAG: CHC2 zinc finger domain-containing protein [Candidatus Taylorbacteria bacterium]